MNKLKSMLEYELKTSIRTIAIYYAIFYAIYALVFIILDATLGKLEESNSSMETSDAVFLIIFGFLGYRIDFKMLIQNGFTRKQIFASGTLFFIFVTGVMSLIHTVVTGGLLKIIGCHCSGFDLAYGDQNFITKWIFIFMFYAVILFFSYFLAILLNRFDVGIRKYVMLAILGVIILVTAICNLLLSHEMITKIVEFISKILGFMDNGTINFLYPYTSGLIIMALLGFVNYRMIRRSEIL